ncbi:MAG: hypothetical protein U1F11_00660 [Steroidobacteraceae bacterium]
MITRALRAGFLYFLWVFGAGFLLGTLRQLVVIPLVGARTAELIEIPLMIAVVVLAARWTVRRPLAAAGAGECALAGLACLVLLLAAEAVVGVALRGLTLRQAFIERDPLTGTLYYGSILLMAVLPWWLGRARLTPR